MIRLLLPLVVIVAFAVGPVACHHADGPHPVTLSTSDRVPAASGSFQVGDGGNGNSSLHLIVRNLAPAVKMSAGATTYVVWVRALSPDAVPQNVGALHLDGNLQGTLDSVTPHKQFEVFVTSEPSPAVPQPSGQKLLWGRIGE